jgi:hypothetical protein
MRGFMDEVEKHCQVLGIDEACTQAELEEAYRERALAWNPDKFAGNTALQEKACEKLGHINAAHDFLLVKLFQPAVSAVPTQPAEPAPVEASRATEPESEPEWKPEPIAPVPRKRTAFFVTVGILLFLVLCAALLLIWGTDW